MKRTHPVIVVLLLITLVLALAGTGFVAAHGKRGVEKPATRDAAVPRPRQKVATQKLMRDPWQKAPAKLTEADQAR